MKKFILVSLMAFLISPVCFAQESDEQPTPVDQVHFAKQAPSCDVATFEIKNAKFETVAMVELPVVCAPSGDYAVVPLPGSGLQRVADKPVDRKQSFSVSIANKRAPLRC